MLKLLPILFAAASAAPLITDNYTNPLIIDDWYITQYRESANDLHTFHADGDLFGIDDLATLEGGYVFACYVTYNDVSGNFAYLELEYYVNTDYLDRFDFIAVDILFGLIINDEISASSIGSFTYSNTMYLNNTIGLTFSSFQTDEALENWDFFIAEYEDYNLVSAESYDTQQGDFFFNVALGGEYLTNQEAFNNGYQVGVQDGIQQTPTGAINWFGGMFEAIGGIFNIEIFPNVKLIYVIGIPVAVAVLAFVLKALIN